MGRDEISTEEGTGMEGGGPELDDEVRDGTTAGEAMEEGGRKTAESAMDSPSVTPGSSSRTMSSRPETRSGARSSHSTVAKLTSASRALPRKPWITVSVVISAPNARAWVERSRYMQSTTQTGGKDMRCTIAAPNAEAQIRAPAESAMASSELRMLWRRRCACIYFIRA
jgi:hypothetical protein